MYETNFSGTKEEMKSSLRYLRLQLQGVLQVYDTCVYNFKEFFILYVEQDRQRRRHQI